MKKHTFFIQWWTIGNDEYDIESATFHLRTKFLNVFLGKFKKGDKRSIVFLKRCEDDRVLIDRRGHSV